MTNATKTAIRSERLADRILMALQEKPGLTDRELSDLLLGANVHPSRINQECRLIESSGRLLRQMRSDGRIGNYPEGVAPPPAPAPSATAASTDQLSEDDVKRHLQRWLEARGWSAEIAWGKARGTDIVARRDGAVWMIEVKGCGSRSEMRVNYFIGMLGELLQRMSDEHATYSIAIPAMRQFQRLWQRLPELARRRTGISALFVSADGNVEHSSDLKADAP